MKKALKKSIPAGLLILIGAGVWLRIVKFESEKPVVKLGQDSPFVGPQLSFSAGDRKSGVAEIEAEAVQSGRTVPLFAEKISGKGERIERAISLRPLPQGLFEGDVRIRITAKDRSWNGGNRSILEKNMVIDTRPPQVSLLGVQHYVNRGGAGLVTYEAGEAVALSGIQVGDQFFTGFPSERNRHLAYYALPFDAPQDIAFGGVAEDVAGNRAAFKFRPNIKTKVFKKDAIQITYKLLADILPYFKSRDSALQGPDIDIFLALNRNQRKSDTERIQKICRDTSPRPLWSGPFLRLPDAKPMASFGQERTYFFKGKEIDRQIHLGIDLASLTQCPIPAANSGRVVFAGPLGIYGNTVVLDHGCGLFSMYSHLSRIEVEAKANAARGETLGRSGSTGLAGGDHLHFAMLVQGIFINPIEWWDGHWIQDNIELKMK